MKASRAGHPAVWSALRRGKQWARRAAFTAWRTAHRVAGREMVAVTVFDELELMVRTDDFRGFRVWQTGGSQRDKIALLKAMCSARPGVFVDVGANYGEFSVIPATLGVHCLLFEPNPTIVPCVRRTFADSPQVHVHNKALGAAPGNIRFHYNTAGSGSGSVIDAAPRADALWQSAAHVKTADIPLSTVDLEIAASGADVSKGVLIKIDVEGYEREVLEGAKTTLTGAAWWLGLIEFSPSALSDGGKSVAAEWEYFRQFPGTIVSGETGASFDIAGKRLPGTPPAGDVDLLIGGGSRPPGSGA